MGDCVGTTEVGAELDDVRHCAGTGGADCWLAGERGSTAGGGGASEGDGAASGNERSGGGEY